MKGKIHGHIQTIEWNDGLDKFLQSIRSTICLTVESIGFFIDNLGSVKASLITEISHTRRTIDTEGESHKDDEFHLGKIKYDNLI